MFGDISWSKLDKNTPKNEKLNRLLYAPSKTTFAFGIASRWHQLPRSSRAQSQQNQEQSLCSKTLQNL